MSNLKNKSEINFEAAKELIDKSFYPSSVHCSYYSCFQLLKFKMNDFFGVTYEQLATDISFSGKGTHQYLISYVTKEIKENISKDSSRDFSRSIKDLKLFREKSDYEDIEIKPEEGEKAYRIAEYLLDLIKKTL